MKTFILLVDFGSTYTKVTALDLENERILGRFQTPTTVDTDISIGFKKAVNRLLSLTGLKDGNIEKVLACSSAAGGLRMVAVGLVPELTVKAAKLAALSAGAKVVGTFAFELTKGDLNKIRCLKPDIILLSGGIDGGNTRTIIHNAHMLTRLEIDIPIVVAGNRIAADEISDIFKSTKMDVRITENVMPGLDSINVTGVRDTIREVFVKHIVKAKGLDKVSKYIDGIVQPTPAAVLACAELLSVGCDGEEGIGELLVIDIGGATTDIYSISTGEPTKTGVLVKGLKEPYAKRTVEGDLGIRYNAENILKEINPKGLMEDFELPIEDLESKIHLLTENVSYVPENTESERIDILLAKMAVKIAMGRHAGVIEQVYSSSGEIMVQYGKDLSNIRTIIGCGGIFSFGTSSNKILGAALYDNKTPFSLKPKNAKFYIDKLYIMAHLGLLAKQYPEKVIRIMKSNLHGI